MRWWYATVARIRAILFRSAEDAALEEEVAFHIQMEVRKLEASGLSSAEALRQAHLRFGGTERMKQRAREERGTRLFEESWTDLRFGLRVLKRSPSFALGAVIALALGIGSSTAAWSLVDGVLLRPLPWSQPDQLVELRELGEAGRRFYPSHPNFVDWRERSQRISSFASVMPLGVIPVEGLEGPSRVTVLGLSQRFFETLGVRPLMGRTFLDEENVVGGPDVAMVSEDYWRRWLGAPESLDGVSVRAFDSDYQVVGVVPATHRFVEEADFYFPHERWPGTARGAHAYRVFGRLAEGVSQAQAKEEMDGIAAAIQAEYPGQTQAESIQLTPLREMMLGTQRRPLGMLLGAAGLVLLVASVNVGSTLLARGTDRMRELSVRTSLGAGTGRLTRQLLLEALVLAVVGGLGGIAAAWAFVQGAIALAPGVMPRMENIGISGPVLGFAAALTLGTTLLFGLVPALRLARSNGLAAGGLGNRGGSRRTRGWGLLLAVESGLAVVLLIGAGLMLRSVGQITGQPPGWSDDGVLEVRFGLGNGAVASTQEGVAFLNSVIDGVSELPGVASVGFTNFTPLAAGSMTAPATDPTRAENPENYSGWRLVNREYFHALQIPVMEGRLMEESEMDGAVINQALATRLWPGESAIGKLITSNFDSSEEPYRVVGVVADAIDWRRNPEDQTEMYVPWLSRPEQIQFTALVVRTESRDESAMVQPLHNALRTLGPRVAWEVRPMSQALAASAADRAFISAVLATFAGVGGAVALVGILGVVGYSVSRRRRELGIRMALGARSSGVRGEILIGLSRSVIPGIVAGLVAAALLSRVLESLLYDVSPLDWSVYAGVAVLFGTAALLAGDLPARRGAATDPAIVLREE